MQKIQDKLEQWVIETGQTPPVGELIANPPEISKEGAVASLYNIVLLGNRINQSFLEVDMQNMPANLAALTSNLQIFHQTYQNLDDQQKMFVGKFLENEELSELLDFPQSLVDKANTERRSPYRFVKRSLMVVARHINAIKHNLKGSAESIRYDKLNTLKKEISRKDMAAYGKRGDDRDAFKPKIEALGRLMDVPEHELDQWAEQKNFVSHTISEDSFYDDKNNLLTDVDKKMDSLAKSYEHSDPPGLGLWDRFVLFLEKNIVLRFLPRFIPKPKGPQLKESEFTMVSESSNEEEGKGLLEDSKKLKTSSAKLLDKIRKEDKRKSMRPEDIREEKEKVEEKEETEGLKKQAEKLEGTSRSFLDNVKKLTKKQDKGDESKFEVKRK